MRDEFLILVLTGERQPLMPKQMETIGVVFRPLRTVDHSVIPYENTIRCPQPALTGTELLRVHCLAQAG